MKIKYFSIAIIIFMFFTFLVYHFKNQTTFNVLKVYNPSSIALDLNSNGKIDSEEKFIINGIETLSSKKSDIQKTIADDLQLDETTLLAIGYFAEKYAQNLLEEKKVKIKTLSNDEIEVFINGKSYNNTFLTSPFAMKDGKPVNKELFKKQIELTQKAKLRIYNNKSNKYHSLDCKYGQMAHDSVILPLNQIPKTAKGCNFCIEQAKVKTANAKSKKNSKNKNQDLNIAEKNKIKNIQPRKFIVSQGDIILFLTDLSTNFKPHNRCTTEFCTTLVKQINNSTKTIDMALYGYSDITDITNALENAVNRGVKIRCVYDITSSNSNFYSDTFNLIKILPDSKADYGESSYQSAIMHNKFFVFDDKIVLTGSANISVNDLSGFNSNTIVLINSSEIAKIYKQEFNQMYEGNFHDKKTEIKNKENILLGDSIISIYFSPLDKTITNKIIPLINNAEQYIYIPSFIITHKKVTQALINAKKRGVDIRIILDATNANNSYSTHEQLRKEGIQVKTENFAGKMHAKSIIIDDKYIITGSMNFSRSGETKNDENTLIIENRNLAKYYKNFFDYLWAKIPTIWLSKNVSSESHDSIGSCFDGIDNDFDGKIDSEDTGCKVH